MYTFSRLGTYGRFGNQLFQIAATIGAARQHNDDYVLPQWQYADHFVGKFNTGKVTPTARYEESSRGFNYHEIPKALGCLDLHGYFQSEKYFVHCQQEIRDLLVFKNHHSRRIGCSIHVRHGDSYDRQHGSGHLLCPQFHPVMTDEYYEQAIAKMVSEGVATFGVFTDHQDTEKWFRSLGLLDQYNHTFVHGLSDFDDFRQMCSFEHSIIANSTFSWWAAWLKGIESITVCPRYQDWFGPGYAKHDTSDVLPVTWKQIPQYK